MNLFILLEGSPIPDSSSVIDTLLKHWPYTVTLLVLVIGAAFGGIIGGIRIGRKYTHWTDRIVKAEDDCKKIPEHYIHISTINTTLISLDSKITILDNKVTPLWQSFVSVSKSPAQLNDKGIEVLDKSGIDKVLDIRFEEILNNVKGLNPTNAYEGQQIIIAEVNKLKNNADLKNTIENGAFNSGMNVDTVLFVGAIYIRDKILRELHFDIDDIDKHSPPVAK